MRGKGRSTIVWVLMGMLVLGLGGFGVRNFSGGTADVATVGDIPIPAQDYARAVRAETRDFAERSGKQPTPEQVRAMGLDRAALSRLVIAAALEAEARRIGVSVGDRRVAEQITSSPAFRGADGRFDRARYAEALRHEGLRESRFEHDLRMDQARTILQQAVLAGVVAPGPVTDRTLGWLLETRDIRWQELTAADLPAPVATPDEATLRAWHEANAARFTAPETRSITYAWLTPEMLERDVEVDEKALRDLYQSRIAEFRQPERRMVERLVFPTMAAAEEAKARLDRGETSFEKLAAERGLTLGDLDLGEVTKADLGPAGEAVFALPQPGIAGPVNTDLGPALFSMNAILEPVDIPFEQARDDLRAEAALDRARRQIDEHMSEYSDLLAGGASLEDLARDTPLELGHIDWRASDEPGPGSVAAYPEFREAAARITDKDFPELIQLEDGGVIALRLDRLTPPALIPFDQVRDRVAADWMANETHRQLLALAEDRRLAREAASDPRLGPTPAATTAAAQAVGALPAPSASAPPTATPPTATPAPGASSPATPPGGTPDAAVQSPAAGRLQTGLARGGFIEGVPQDVVSRAFEIATPGTTEVIDAENRVFLVTLERIDKADTSTPEAQQLRAGIASRLADSLRQDVFDYFARALQTRVGVTVNQTALDAVNARLQ